MKKNIPCLDGCSAVPRDGMRMPCTIEELAKGAPPTSRAFVPTMQGMRGEFGMGGMVETYEQ